MTALKEIAFLYMKGERRGTPPTAAATDPRAMEEAERRQGIGLAYFCLHLFCVYLFSSSAVLPVCRAPWVCRFLFFF